MGASKVLRLDSARFYESEAYFSRGARDFNASMTFLESLFKHTDLTSPFRCVRVLSVESQCLREEVECLGELTELFIGAC